MISGLLKLLKMKTYIDLYWLTMPLSGAEKGQ